MQNFDRKVEEAGARVNQKVADVAERMERETAELITYLNNEVVPAIRAHSTKALRVAADKLAKMADYLDEQKRSHL
jgi:KaiC/GvpD/RAD55 family RecA-like ATPase